MTSAEPVTLLASQVAHFSPYPDPEAQWRGMSLLHAVLSEISADSAATRHKLKFFENNAMPGTIVTYGKDVPVETVQAFVKIFKEQLRGADNAYSTLHLGGGADVTVAGTDLKQLDFKAVQGAGETRVAAALRVPPVIAGLSEGLAGSSLNAGNFNAARRLFADGTVRPWWRMAAAALQSLVDPPDAGAHLWYDDRDVPFLREDAKEEASIRQIEAATIETLVRSGWAPQSARDAVLTGDYRKLEHTGLFSVQLQPPNSNMNGNGKRALRIERDAAGKIATIDEFVPEQP